MNSTTGETQVNSTTGEAQSNSTTGETQVNSTTGEAQVNSTTGETQVNSTTGEAQNTNIFTPPSDWIRVSREEIEKYAVPRLIERYLEKSERS